MSLRCLLHGHRWRITRNSLYVEYVCRRCTKVVHR